jgi:thioredoxin 1
MRDVTDATFDEDVLRAQRPVVVDFWAPWCKPCEAVEAVLAALERDHEERLEVARVDVDANPALAARYGVLALPTAMLFVGGEPRATAVGAHSPAHYERLFGLG